MMLLLLNAYALENASNEPMRAAIGDMLIADRLNQAESSPHMLAGLYVFG